MADDLPRSSQTLWVLLSGTTQLKSSDIIKEELYKNEDKLIDGVLFYRPRLKSDEKKVADAQGSSKSKTNEYPGVPNHFMDKMSSLLGLKKDICYDLFCGYLTYEFKGTAQSISHMFSSDKAIESLLNQLWHYYYLERVYNLFNLKHILGHWKSDLDHPYRILYEEFINSTQRQERILNKLVTQLEVLSNAKLPSYALRGQYLTENLVSNWVSRTIKEMIEVLQMILLFYRDLPSDSDITYRLLKLFHSHGFGARLSFVKLAANNYLPLEQDLTLDIELIELLEVSIIVECLEVDWFCECMEKDLREHHLLQSPEKFKRLAEFFNDTLMTATTKQHGTLFLAWMLIMSWENPTLHGSMSEEERGALVKNYGSQSMRLNSFGRLVKLLKNSHFRAMQGTESLTSVNQVVFRLIHMVFTLYQVDTMITAIDSLYELSTLLLDDQNCANLFFEAYDADGGAGGVGAIFTHALRLFPAEMSPLMKSLNSLAKNDSSTCIKLLRIISHINVYTEPFDPSLPYLVCLRRESVYQLTADRRMFGIFDIAIPNGTIGYLSQYKENPIIQWQDVSFDTLEIMAHIMRENLSLISSGHYHSVTPQDIGNMTDIVSFIGQVLHNSSSAFSRLKPLIDLSFQLYDLLCQFSQPPRLLMASLIKEFSALMKSEKMPPKEIWKKVVSKSFFPYQIGLLSQQISKVALGNDTNFSTIGEIIASEECTIGSFDLTLAYLKFLETYIGWSLRLSSANHQQSLESLLNDTHLIASIIYVINHVFPSYHLWKYNSGLSPEEGVRAAIGRACSAIFSDILIAKRDYHLSSPLIEVCIYNLKENLAGQQLLRIIQEGSSITKNAVDASGAPLVLTTNESIQTVRNATKILKHLLEVSEQQSELPSVPKKKHSTPLERVLFTPQEKSSMLLITCHYVHQRYDTSLATYAIDLLGQLAKSFPMSMLACLGGEAEYVRDLFLLRLDAITEDVWLKVAILRFFTVCVKHQPGLIEMLLNTGLNGGAQPESETSSCLQTVVDILSEKREAKHYCPESLHLAALEFLYSFWVQPHFMAINSLKKIPDIWTLITFPFIERSQSQNLNLKIIPVILRLLAREIFYVKSLEREAFSPNLIDNFAKIKESDHLKRLSDAISNSVLTQPNSSSSSQEIMISYRDFVICLARYEPFEVSQETKKKIILDLLTSLYRVLDKEEQQTENSLLKLIADTLLISLNRWELASLVLEDAQTSSTLLKLQYLASDRQQTLSFGFLKVFNLLLISFLVESFDDKRKEEIYGDWIRPICSLLSGGFRIFEKAISTSSKKESSTPESRLVVSYVHLLNKFVSTHHSQTQVWLPAFRSSSILELLTSTTIYLMERKLALDVNLSIVNLLITLASNAEAAKLLHKLGLTDQVILTLGNIHEDLSDIEKKRLTADGQETWTHLFYGWIQVNTCLIRSLKHDMALNAINFIAVHYERMEAILSSVRVAPLLMNVDGANSVADLIWALVLHGLPTWRAQHDVSYSGLIDQLMMTCHSAIAFLCRSQLLNLLIETPEAKDLILNGTHPSSVSPMKSAKSVSFSEPLNTSLSESTTQTPRKMTWGSHVQAVDVLTDKLEDTTMKTRRALFEYVGKSLVILCVIYPNILDIISKQGFLGSSDCRMILVNNFSPPSVHPDGKLSFGTLLSCFCLTLKTLARMAKEKGHGFGSSRNGAQRDSNNLSSLSCASVGQLNLIMECSLSLLISQALLSKLDDQISQRDKDLIATELKTELNSMIASITRQPKKTFSSVSLHLSTPRSSQSAILESNFVKLLLQILEKSF